MTDIADVVIVGAGIAGVSAAHHLTRHGINDIVIVDPRPPLTLTSDKSTECYRNWWPDAPMIGLMNRSIDIFEELAEETDFGFNRNGYLFVTAEGANFDAMRAQAQEVASLGATARALETPQLRDRFPFVTETAIGAVEVPRAGWFRAQDLGLWMLEGCRARGTRLLRNTVTGLSPTEVELADGTNISTGGVVIAAGPLSADVAALVGIELPLFSELHLKVAFKDHLQVIPRDAPMTIWSDRQTLDWTEEERQALEEAGRTDILGEMPIYCHFRPEGGEESPYILALWEYHGQVVEPTWPLAEDPLYPEVVMKGLTTMVPGLGAYSERLPESFVDGGYYTKTRENRPLIGPSGVDGVHLMTAMSGFGIMVSAGAGDLLARHVAGSELPPYAGAFLLERYDDPQYLENIGDASSGQL